MERDIKSKLKISRLLDFYGNLLSERQKEICELYFNDDLSLSEIADEIGITRQGVCDSIKKGEASLYDFEKRIGLMEKFLELQNNVVDILEIVKSINGVSDEDIRKIEQLAQNILS